MRKPRCIAFFFVVSVLLSAGSFVQAQKADGPTQQRGTWTGEVVDLGCYLATGVVGEANRTCHLTKRDALKPGGVKNGQPMGLLTDDGTLVLLVPEVAHMDAFKALAERVGKHVQLKGRLVQQPGRTLAVLFPAGDG